MERQKKSGVAWYINDLIRFVCLQATFQSQPNWFKQHFSHNQTGRRQKYVAIIIIDMSAFLAGGDEHK